MTPAAPIERFGPFVLLRSLGSGGMGSVWLALHAPDGPKGEPFVVKRLHAGMAAEPTMLERFVHEAEVASHVRNPHVAELVAMGTVATEPFLATEYVFGVPLATLIDRIEEGLTPKAPMGPALRLGFQLASGVKGIHSAIHRETGVPLGLVHRDLGARNVMVGFDGRARIIDLGLGKSTLSQWQTSAEILAGSPDYMPPEQVMGIPVDARADVYALAVTLWELLAGRRRIRVESVRERIERCLGARPEPIRDIRPELSPRFEELLMTAMRPEPQLRLADVEVLQTGLRDELRRLGGADDETVAGWLEASCATLRAQGARQLEADRQAGLALIGEAGAATRMLVGDVSAFVRRAGPVAGASSEEAGPLVPSNRSSSPRPSGPPTPSGPWAQVSETLAGGRTTPQAILLILGGMLVVALLSAWVTTELSKPAAARVEVAPLEAVTSPIHPPQLTPTGSGFGALSPPSAADGLSAAPGSIDGSSPPNRGRRATRRNAPRRAALSPALASRQEALVDRLRRLRRRTFEVRFQRRLTRLSAQITSARRPADFDALEARLSALEVAD